MGKIMINGVDYSGGGGDNAIYCTLAEYTAWEQAGTLIQDYKYYITDSNPGSVIDDTTESTGSTWSSTKIVNMIYPVGSIFISTSNVNPGTYFTGTTWEAFGSGRTLVGVDTSDTDFDTVEETGGEKSHSYTPAGSNSGTAVTMSAVTLNHTGGAVQNTTLDITQIPSHNHGGSTGTNIAYNTSNVYSSGGSVNLYAVTWGGNFIGNDTTYQERTRHSHTITAQGGGKAHGHGFTQPSNHSFTPTTSSVTDPTFTGTAADISAVQPYITTYMWKRIS